jgi:hypothetical protein
MKTAEDYNTEDTPGALRIHHFSLLPIGQEASRKAGQVDFTMLKRAVCARIALMDTVIQTPSNRKSAKGLRTVFWWIGWITLTIIAFFIAAFVWTPIIAHNFGSIRETKAAVLWVTAVFGTWLIVLFPLIVVMYQKVDKAYDEARNRREKAAREFRSIAVDAKKRLLPLSLSEKLKGCAETIEGGHLVTVTLQDGRRIDHVFIANQCEILGIYNATEMAFAGSDVVDLAPVDMNHPPQFFITSWLRLDGVKAPD